MNNRDIHVMNILYKVAEAVEPVGNAKLASAVVIGRNIVSIGVNRRKTHPFQQEHSSKPDCIYLHAENAAILTASKILDTNDWKRARLYVCRIKWSDQYKTKHVFGNSCPCAGCWSAIKSYRPMYVIHTTDDGPFKTVSRQEF